MPPEAARSEHDCGSGAASLVREPEQQHVAVLDEVFLAFETHLAGLLGRKLTTERHEIVVGNGLGADKALFEVVWMAPAALGALDPAFTVQARASLGPTVKKVIRFSTR